MSNLRRLLHSLTEWQACLLLQVLHEHDLDDLRAKVQQAMEP